MMSARRDRWGGYWKFSSDFTNNKYSYSWRSDQEFPEGAGFNPEAGKRKTNTEITAGLLTAVTGWLSVYAGAGYGKKVELWKDLDSRWVKVSDKSHAGTVAEAGLKYNLGYFTFSTGISTISFRTVSASFGIGVNF
ncbi:MAG: hypothetical protein ACI3ZC_00695 [Candidatus Cryptobacteroides sp.]